MVWENQIARLAERQAWLETIAVERDDLRRKLRSGVHGSPWNSAWSLTDSSESEVDSFGTTTLLWNSSRNWTGRTHAGLSSFDEKRILSDDSPAPGSPLDGCSATFQNDRPRSSVSPPEKNWKTTWASLYAAALSNGSPLTRSGPSSSGPGVAGTDFSVVGFSVSFPTRTCGWFPFSMTFPNPSSSASF